MKRTPYLCQVEQTLRLKVYAGLDRGVNKNSTAFELVSSETVWMLQHCLLFQLMKENSVE